MPLRRLSMVETGRRGGRHHESEAGGPTLTLPRKRGREIRSIAPPALFEQPSGDLHFLVGQQALQRCRNGWNRFTPNRQRPVSPLDAGIEVTLQGWIQGREVGSVVSPAALASLERAPQCRLRRSETRPQIEDVLQLDPPFLPWADVDRLGGLRELGEFP